MYFNGGSSPAGIFPAPAMCNGTCGSSADQCITQTIMITTQGDYLLGTANAVRLDDDMSHRSCYTHLELDVTVDSDMCEPGTMPSKPSPPSKSSSPPPPLPSPPPPSPSPPPPAPSPPPPSPSPPPPAPSPPPISPSPPPPATPAPQGVDA